MGMGTGRRHLPMEHRVLRICGVLLFLVFFVYIVFLRGGSAAATTASSARRCTLEAYDAAATTELDLKDCGLTHVPASILRFTALEKLDVSKNVLLRDLPPLPPSLRTVFALGGGFESIPPSVSALPSIRMLSFKSCRLRDVGDAPLPTSLEWLILTDNQLEALPDSLPLGLRILRYRRSAVTEVPIEGGSDAS